MVMTSFSLAKSFYGRMSLILKVSQSAVMWGLCAVV